MPASRSLVLEFRGGNERNGATLFNMMTNRYLWANILRGTFCVVEANIIIVAKREKCRVVVLIIEVWSFAVVLLNRSY